MASSASSLLKLELQADGENNGTWGAKAVVTFSRLEQAVADITNISLASLGGANYTLEDTQYASHVDGSNTSESHVAMIKATGTLTAAEQIIVPLRNKMYWVWNATSAAYAVTVGGSTGGTIEVPQGYIMGVVCDGTNVEALTQPVTVAGAMKLIATMDGADNTLQKVNMLDYGEVINAIGSTGGGTQDIDIELGNVVSATVDTSANTFTFSNPTATGTCCSFTLVLTNGGSQTVNWPAAVDWPSATAPTLTTSGVDVFTFFTLDGGTIWYGFTGGLGMG